MKKITQIFTKSRSAPFFFLLVAMQSQEAGAWGMRGHAIVATTAAYLRAKDNPRNDFLKKYSLQLEYYANVPDFVWKAPATYKEEFYNHFIDMEIFDRKLKGKDTKEAYAMDRVTFNKTFPEIPLDGGRAWWRVREFQLQLEKFGQALMSRDLSKEKRHELQGQWLSLAGEMGHYIGDLSQPLHVTENYDGQDTEQRGIHHFFEETVVEELYPDIVEDVFKEAKRLAKIKEKTLIENSDLQNLQMLTEDSRSRLKELLKID